MRTSVNISFFVSAERAASAASKKDYRSTAYNNYCIKSAAPLLFLQSEKFRLTLPIKVNCLTIKPRETGDLWLRLDNIQLPY